MRTRYWIAVALIVLFLALVPAAFSASDIPPFAQRTPIPETLRFIPPQRIPFTLKSAAPRILVGKTAPVFPSKIDGPKENAGKPNRLIRFLQKFQIGKPEIHLFGIPVKR